MLNLWYTWVRRYSVTQVHPTISKKFPKFTALRNRRGKSFTWLCLIDHSHTTMIDGFTIFISPLFSNFCFAVFLNSFLYFWQLFHSIIFSALFSPCVFGTFFLIFIQIFSISCAFFLRQRNFIKENLISRRMENLYINKLRINKMKNNK